MGVVWNTICASVPESVVNQRFLETEKPTNFLDVESLLVE